MGPLLEYFESVGPWRIQWSHQLPFDDLSHLISNFKIFKHQVTAILAFQACTCFSIQTGFDGFFETSTAQTPHLLEAVNLRLLFHQGDICHLSDQKHSRRTNGHLLTFINFIIIELLIASLKSRILQLSH